MAPSNQRRGPVRRDSTSAGVSRAVRVVILIIALSFITIFLATVATEWWHAVIPAVLALALGVILGKSEREK